MKIVVDINHPAHVHFFKYFIWEMEKRGHNVLVTASEKDVTIKLLDNYGFDYINMGSYGTSLVEKLMNVPIKDFKMYKITKSFRPDIFVGLGSIRAAHVAYSMNRPSITLEDTEHSRAQLLLYFPFTSAVLTPSCFKKDLGEKQIRYNGYHELAYLHPKYFKPDSSVLNELDLNDNDILIVVRSVSWTASHDRGQYGIENRVDFIRNLEKYGRVLITSEGTLEKDLEKYRIILPPEKFHDLLYYATLYIGEGATIATEAAVLGTPSIYISSLAGTMGNLDELERKYDLMYSFASSDDALKKAMELLQKMNAKEDWRIKRNRMLKDKIDVTEFLIWFIENYPRV